MHNAYAELSHAHLAQRDVQREITWESAVDVVQLIVSIRSTPLFDNFLSVRITQMLMGGGCSREKKKFPAPAGGAEKVKSWLFGWDEQYELFNFMLFIVKCDKIISAASYPYRIHPVFITYFLVNETQTF